MSLETSPVEIRMTEDMGRGVFAARAIRKGEPLGHFHTIRIPPGEVDGMRGSTLSHYWFEDDEDGSALLVLGFVELINHSLSPNVDRDWVRAMTGEVARLFAIRDIDAGEQLFIDYKFAGTSDDPAWSQRR